MTKINTDYITLGQLLKIENIVGSGGEVKLIINSLDILVNGVKENRRGRKLYPNDLIEINGQKFTIEK
ncbi:MAG TPA: S4 domain-containing protein YaaA [Erysipelotrichaceae bacterium]|nr:S4 domain-containing protein YaaA [Bacillota bacterium]NLP22203.1 S4 domain-containing protein YaaA [Erysipelotrichaceae bacterium]HCY06471.1 S4 domain-containing protein YaaA [Erysipelotrichaceae bacterium]